MAELPSIVWIKNRMTPIAGTRICVLKIAPVQPQGAPIGGTASIPETRYQDAAMPVSRRTFPFAPRQIPAGCSATIQHIMPGLQIHTTGNQLRGFILYRYLSRRKPRNIINPKGAIQCNSKFAGFGEAKIDICLG